MSYVSTNDTGIPIGNNINNSIVDENFKNENYSSTIIFFVSVNCVKCIDLLGDLYIIKQNYSQYNFIVFSTGEDALNEEMSTYYNWDFPVISIEEQNIISNFNVLRLPFTMIIDECSKVKGKGVVYNSNDFELLIYNL